MKNITTLQDHAANRHWLKRYYVSRAAFSIAWIVAVVTLTQRSTAAAAVLLVMYPAWDALANIADGRRSGGLAANSTQLLNVVASLVVALAIAAALPDMHRVLALFGAWAIVSGLTQLGTGLRRWKTVGAQWSMVLSGAQSALAGAAFMWQARLPAEPTIASLAGYAGFGAVYFLAAALTLQLGARGKLA